MFTLKMRLLIPLAILFYSSIVPAEVMRGMYSYMADTGLFLDCQKQQRIPVAMKGDNITLERAYLKKRYLAGKSLLVELDGRIEQRKKMEGDGKQDTLIVDKFLAIKQQETCAGSVPPSPLKNTYWKLVELEGQHLTDNPLWLEGQRNGGAKQRQMHFIIKAGSHNLTGFGGCNDFNGPVKNTTTEIIMGPFRTSRKACLNLKIESEFLTLLSKIDHYAIKGEMLELFRGNKPVARLIAIYF